MYFMMDFQLCICFVFIILALKAVIFISWKFMLVIKIKKKKAVVLNKLWVKIQRLKSWKKNLSINIMHFFNKQIR